MKIECTEDPVLCVEYFPPPWNIEDHPEKTEGWIEFQKALRKDPAYYLDQMKGNYFLAEDIATNL